MMKGYLIQEHTQLSDISKCLKSDVPDPTVSPDEDNVIVDIHSAGLNFFDILMAAGKYQNQPEHPYVLGAEIAGVIAKDSPIPEGCNFIPGKTRVFGSAQGAYAEKVAAPHWTLLEIPDGLSFEQAAGLYITWPTSYAALKLRASVQPGEWLLVHAGAGGVGISALLLGKLLGAKTIATAGSEEKLRICKEHGKADYVVNYRDKDWQAQVKKITGGHGCDVIYDPVGLVVPSMKVVAWNGRIIVVGFAAGTIEKAPMNLVLLKNISIVGVHWGAYMTNEADRIPAVWQALLELLGSGKATPVVMDPVYEGLESLPRGLTDLQNRKTWGKAILRVKPDPKFPPKAANGGSNKSKL
ncbi:NAD(P)-binding protein [Tilletiaria anomala UBC 951]|uniref:NAD(P)-binding protein n=1 Tax=Tilletiaria anomala (strain ATCC 24038 / CBS 436.72 / UBC 951) TaxID=1037660 RepID=A0A066WRT0_TILAU|nr:NAD(P)-binding protein [Tilletiaria anomala UBC 951]KDN53340.1 NAD(P)-binding protein [Tilletiaria anomala UBC 951]